MFLYVYSVYYYIFSSKGEFHDSQFWQESDSRFDYNDHDYLTVKNSITFTHYVLVGSIKRGEIILGKSCLWLLTLTNLGPISDFFGSMDLHTTHGLTLT